MENRYAWRDRIFDTYDFVHRRDYDIIVIDRKTGKEYVFGQCSWRGHNKIVELNPALQNQEFWDFACATAPDACIYVPDRFQTPEVMKTIAKNTSYKYNLQNMNLERLEMEAGLEAVEEVCSIMILRFCDALTDIPSKYLTDRVVNQAIDTYLKALSRLPMEERTFDRCVRSVSKWGKSLNAVPEDMRSMFVETKDGKRKLYEIALDVDGMALGAVPDDELTSEVCISVLKKNPLAIKYVPVRFITPEFVKELIVNDIVLSPKDRCYVRECINVWAKRNGIIDIPDIDFNMMINSSQNEDWRNIRLDDMPYMFPKKMVDKLNRRGITNLSELFMAYDNNVFENDPIFAPGDFSLELMGIVNILSCKFRRRDPIIDLEQIDYTYMQSKMGLPKAFAREVSRRGFCVKDLLEQLALPFEKQIWNNFGGWCRVGDGAINSAIEKIVIVSDYYSNITSDKKRENEIEMLNEELASLQQRSAVIDGQINKTIQRIEKLKSQRKMASGVSYVKK